MKLFVILVVLVSCLYGTYARAVVDKCMRQPTINGLCLSTTLGIYYDVETQRCKYMGCSPDKLFPTVEECERICNSNKHRRRRLQYTPQQPVA